MNHYDPTLKVLVQGNKRFILVLEKERELCAKIKVRKIPYYNTKEKFLIEGTSTLNTSVDISANIRQSFQLVPQGFHDLVISEEDYLTLVKQENEFGPVSP